MSKAKKTNKVEQLRNSVAKLEAQKAKAKEKVQELTKKAQGFDNKNSKAYAALFARLTDTKTTVKGFTRQINELKDSIRHERAFIRAEKANAKLAKQQAKADAPLEEATEIKAVA